VKTFERVPGATVEGTAPANTTVTASVRMEMPSSNSTFTYRQQATTDEQGTFEMTLPYSTTGYDQWGVSEGYTNVSVRATGPYQFSTPRRLSSENLSVTRYNASAEIPEGAVVGEDEDPVRVTLEKQVVSNPEGATNGSDDGTDTNTTDDGGTSGGSTNDTSSAREPIAPPSSTDPRARATG
jgi:dolichyl-diphosphooligosaccharide--protein glycosyltransferase